MAKEKYTYVYGVTVCPSCGHNLQEEGGITVECVVDGKTVEVADRLDHNGILQDDEMMVANGKHSATFCGGCLEPLIEYEHQITYTRHEDFQTKVMEILDDLKS